jgi:hypothetical protein
VPRELNIGLKGELALWYLSATDAAIIKIMKLCIYKQISNELHYFSISFGLWGIYFKRYLPTGKFYTQTARATPRGQVFWYSVKNPYRND